MSLVFSSICPHPPIIIPTIGGEELEKIKNSVQALEKLNKEFVQTKPGTVVVISPHAPTLPQAFCISRSEDLSGNFGAFGDFSTELKFKNDTDLADEILKSSKKQIPIQAIENPELDHGILVPLYYVTKGYTNIKLVPLSFSILDLDVHFQFGKNLFEIINQSKKKIAVIASGDLSHRLTPSAPAGYSPKGKEFDKKLVDLLKKKDIKGILNLDPELIEEAGECGLRSIIILLGILDKIDYQVEILSYEGPFGVGYLVAQFKL